MTLRVPWPYIWGCPICGGKRHRRIETKIRRRREDRAWRKDQEATR